MGNGLKVLVGTACLVIIAGGGYYFWSEYQREVQREAARVASEERSLRNRCEQMIGDLARDDVEGYLVGDPALCIELGHLSEEDFREAGAGRYLDQAQSLLGVSSGDSATPAQVGSPEWLAGQ